MFTELSDYTIFLKECVPNEMENYQDFLNQLQRKKKESTVAHDKFVNCALKHPFTMTKCERILQHLPRRKALPKAWERKQINLPGEDYSMYISWVAEPSGNPLTDELRSIFKYEKYIFNEIWHLVRTQHAMLQPSTNWSETVPRAIMQVN